MIWKEKVIIQNYGGGTNMEERYRSSYEIKTYFLNLTSPRVSYSLQIDSLPGGNNRSKLVMYMAIIRHPDRNTTNFIR